MNFGDLVMCIKPGPDHGYLGLITEEEEWEGHPGFWVEYFIDRSQWRFYTFDERYDVEVLSECR